VNYLKTVSRPNLFIIGAMKAGTTSLHNYLNAHPDIVMSEPKEPCYFVHPQELNWPQIEQLQLWQNEAKYLALFPDAAEAKVMGESSTPYAKFPAIGQIPERIARFNPEARFIYVLRDPIERTISHYLHEVRRGHEYRDMVTAIRQNPLYTSVSNYDLQLRQYLNYFDLRQFLVLTFEAMTADTAGTITQVFQWLDVDPTFQPPNLTGKAHVTPKRFYQKGRLYRLRYSWPWNQIAELLPNRVRKLGLKTLIREVDRDAELVHKQAVIDYLRPIQQPQVRQLSQLLNREFPEWSVLWGANTGDDQSQGGQAKSTSS